MRFVKDRDLEGPLTQDMALNFVRSRGATPNCRAIRYAVLRRFAEYLAIYDPRTHSLDPHALPRSRVIPTPRILTDQELGLLFSSIDRLSPRYPQLGRTLATIIGLLASTGLRSGEALRLDRGDVDSGDRNSGIEMPGSDWKKVLTPLSRSKSRELLRLPTYSYRPFSHSKWSEQNC